MLKNLCIRGTSFPASQHIQELHIKRTNREYILRECTFAIAEDRMIFLWYMSIDVGTAQCSQTVFKVRIISGVIAYLRGKLLAWSRKTDIHHRKSHHCEQHLVEYAADGLPRMLKHVLQVSI